MKPVLLLLWGVLTFSDMIAQELAPAVLQQEATAATRQLARVLSLDDARQLTVRRYTQQRLMQETEARRRYANEPAALQRELTYITQQYVRNLSISLTAAQFQRYQAATALPAAVAATIPAADQYKPYLPPQHPPAPIKATVRH